MGSKLIVEPDAQIEIYDAIDWYESKQTGLGEEFYNYLEGYFETLRNGNANFPIKRKPVFRELPLKRFPYVIIYTKEKDAIYVYSVFNAHQHPLKKVK
ncbi:type II toxin-antitoxin system RelE/ParE family toxin [Flavivirga abyssicola]|uniref:type II toxin-antitoxin system RelE/ParE family toxin n=1 Tax=Flavivirga abyssicola TaxID=3063533 RepID=UPI0026DFBBB9|nr:type II toxin-antitoxin system RelE/ParE family toxin [Flavivirga sp. MEBiC07777]WVK12508.1 type II toxin-antitoxin system RelE/ParE family toxin [Flavivirga sp. MEBiC07777]